MNGFNECSGYQNIISKQFLVPILKMGLLSLFCPGSGSFFNSQDKTVTWFWRLREIFDGQKTKGDRLPLENMLEGLISQVHYTEYHKYKRLNDSRSSKQHE